MAEKQNQEQEKRTWKETLHLLDTEYTTSIKDVCQTLKTSREWVNRYIRPHARTIYVNTNNYDSDKKRKTNYLFVASKTIGKELVGSTWMHTGDVNNLLLQSIVSCTKQTKYIDVACLMTRSDAQDYCRKYKVLLDDMKHSVLFPHRFAELYKKSISLHLEYLDADAQELLKNQCSVTERTKVDRIDVAYPRHTNPQFGWIAIHDIKEYGDTDEAVYRKLFREGAIRIELAVPDANGICGQKVYYIEDPSPMKCEEHSFFCTVPEADWLKYKKKKRGS